MSTWLEFAAGRLGELWLRTGEHLMLTGVSLGAAILAGIPLGIGAARAGWLRGPLTGAVGILQTIPSLAMLAILLALFQKIGAIPAVTALSLYALLPIVRNTIAGLDGVPPSALEAARGIGMTRAQQLRLIELPLALPVMVAGVRTAAVVGIGVATLSAFIGAGGLGQFINRGLALSNTDLILLGALPAAALALVVDASIAAFQWGLGRRHPPLPRALALAGPLVIAVLGAVAYRSDGAPPAGNGVVPIRIGTKNFTEQMILGELMAQRIEGVTGISVKRVFDLGGTLVCHGALVGGEIDLYAEYTGTGLTAILKLPVIADPEAARRIVADAYARRFGLRWLPSFGFNNTYAITVRRGWAEERGLKSITDLSAVAREARAGFTSEFSERPDGYPGLHEAYGISFREVVDLDPSLMYTAIAGGEVDVICAFATDGRIAAFDLQPLADDRGFFPPYHAAPVVRAEILEAHPEITEALRSLAGLLNDETMQRLNYEVDGRKRSPREVAREFLESEGLLGD